MAKVRNSAELGSILFKIALYLAKDSELCKYLHYSVDNPLDEPDIEGVSLLNKNILVVPEVNRTDFNTASKICIIVNDGIVQTNKDFKAVTINIIVYTPLRAWIVNNLNLRPFLIMGKIEQLLKGKRLEGLGNVNYEGFSLVSIDDKISGYSMEFTVDVFN